MVDHFIKGRVKISKHYVKFVNKLKCGFVLDFPVFISRKTLFGHFRLPMFQLAL